MSVAEQDVPLASLIGRVPFTVRFAPQFVNRMFDRLQKSVPTQGNVAGLLFGRMDQDVSEVQVFRSIAEGDRQANVWLGPEQLSEMVERLIANSRKDPEVSALSLLGWYSFRATGGLHESDVAFHNRFFRLPSEIALILRPEAHPNVLFEIYSKSGTTLLSEDEHRWGSLRLSSASTVLGPIDVAMRAKIGDDFYLRAYQVSKTLDRAERREQWAGAIEATKNRVRSIFRRRKDTYPSDETATENEIARVTPERETPGRPFARAAAAAAAEPPVFSRPAGYQGVQQGISGAGSAAEPAFTRRGRELTPASARHSAALQKIVAGDPPALPAVIKAPRRGVPWLSSVIVFAIAAGATFALYVEGYATSGETPHFLRAIFPDTGLGLRVEGQGDRVLLSWNRRNALVRSSQGGVLHIDDGPQHRDVRLDPAQMANGSVLYRPGSDDVSFRLEVHGAQGAAIAETTRVLDGAKAEPLEVKNVVPDVSPAPAAAAPATTAPTTREEHPPHEESVGRPAAARHSYVPPPAPTTIAKPVNTPEFRSSAPQGNTALTSAPAPSSVTPTPAAPTHTEASAPGTSGPATMSKPAQSAGSGPVTPSDLHISPPVQTSADSPKTSAPASSFDIGHQTDASKVSNWEDIPSSSKPAALAPPRTAPPQPNDSASPAKPAIDTRPAPTFVPPRPLKQVLPDLRSIPPGSIGGVAQLEVAVRVNKKGRVTEAYLVGDASKVAPHLARAALTAAKEWTFQPATIRGKNVPSDHTIVFEFRPSSH